MLGCCGRFGCRGSRGGRCITDDGIFWHQLAGVLDFSADGNIAPGFVVGHVVYHGT